MVATTDVLDIKSSPLLPLQPLRQGQAGLHWSTQWVLPALCACLSAATSPPELPQSHAQSSVNQPGDSVSLGPRVLAVGMKWLWKWQFLILPWKPRDRSEIPFWAVWLYHVPFAGWLCHSCLVGLLHVSGSCQSSLQKQVIGFAPWQVAEVMQETWQQQC